MITLITLTALWVAVSFWKFYKQWKAEGGLPYPNEINPVYAYGVGMGVAIPFTYVFYLIIKYLP